MITKILQTIDLFELFFLNQISLETMILDFNNIWKNFRDFIPSEYDDIIFSLISGIDDLEHYIIRFIQ